MSYRGSIAVGMLLGAVGCGPTTSVAEDDDGGTTSNDPTTGLTSVDPTNGTSATTAGTSATTASTSTTTATSTVGTFGDDTSEDSSVGYIIDVDGGGGPCSAMSWCDVWAQDCPRDEKCLPWDLCGTGNWSGTRCDALDPNPAAVGESCTVIDGLFAGTDDCDLASMCWNPDPETLQGECVAFCTGSEANPLCSDPATTCFLGFNGNVLSVCLPRCNPLASTCDATESCIFDDGSPDGAFVCLPSVVVAPQDYGEDCSEAEACGTGLLCLDGAHVPGCIGERCCTMLGESTMPPSCPDATQTCMPLYDGVAPEGLQDLCFCGVAE